MDADAGGHHTMYPVAPFAREAGAGCFSQRLNATVIKSSSVGNNKKTALDQETKVGLLVGKLIVRPSCGGGDACGDARGGGDDDGDDASCASEPHWRWSRREPASTQQEQLQAQGRRGGTSSWIFSFLAPAIF
ncbi:hypothetical protein LGH82_07930 [Mesorhizobium sp. PAMC28654]|uniref:hypothetical protein n=1 Tax=Mesorhizobium sp. PAMC28654 TaxID=2880934 RepID=UPI001D0B3B69|nr:hypothetical protein [Mesorhizobium sp. PAMC28654]UDL92980.1 hypothetical protein LGH82_07930 [Mesorhizobium sp. PAMC28654]